MLFTFPSRYSFAIGLWGVFSLAGWSRLIHTEFHVLRATQGSARCRNLACTGLSPSADRLSRLFQFDCFHHVAALLPRRCLDSGGLGSSAFARHYSRNHFCFLLLQVLRCFSSLRSPADLSGMILIVSGCPIRKSADQRPFAPTRGLSQLVTSFFASQSQGIHRTPFCFLLFLTVSLSCVCFQYVNDRFFQWRIRDSNP